MRFITVLKNRNPFLFWYGLINLIGAITCIILIPLTSVEVNGLNAYIKPLKFFISITIFVWSMGYMMHYLEMPGKVKAYNIMAIIIFFYESFVITWQAANGRLSHFNINTPLYSTLFSIMGIAITLLTLWTGYIAFLFFKKTSWQLSAPYVWGIRLGLLFFVAFALEGGVMASVFRHTIGGLDSEEGLPFVNWNRKHGDLRVAHFMGMHALQLLPLFGYYIAKNKQWVFIGAFIYFTVVIAVLAEALAGLPLY